MFTYDFTTPAHLRSFIRTIHRDAQRHGLQITTRITADQKSLVVTVSRDSTDSSRDSTC